MYLKDWGCYCCAWKKLWFYWMSGSIFLELCTVIFRQKAKFQFFWCSQCNLEYFFFILSLILSHLNLKAKKSVAQMCSAELKYCVCFCKPMRNRIVSTQVSSCIRKWFLLKKHPLEVVGFIVKYFDILTFELWGVFPKFPHLSNYMVQKFLYFLHWNIWTIYYHVCDPTGQNLVWDSLSTVAQHCPELHLCVAEFTVYSIQHFYEKQCKLHFSDRSVFKWGI